MTSRRGSYKTPGGKLVNVDFDVDDGVLSDVTVHGDFFLQPDDALQAIAKSLDGAPANLSAAEFSRRIAAALPKGAKWLGSSPEALAEAVVRGLAAPTDEVEAGGGSRGFS